jgi:hypothetical protein
MKPLVSILIPAYNAEEFLSDTLRSAVEQTWPRKEIIVVDDGSRDATLWVARQFGGEGVHVLSQSNQGAAAARNKAFSLCQGEYIQWLDSDDLLAPDKIERQMEVLSGCSSKYTLASCAWGRFMYRRHRATFSPTPIWSDLTPVEWILRKWEHNVYMQTATWLVSRELTEAAGPWNSRLLGDDDGEYFCRVVLASGGMQFVPEAKVYYRKLGSGSLSYVGFSGKKLEAQLLGMELQIGYVRARTDSARVRAACIKYLQTWLPCFHPNRPDLVERMDKLAGLLGGRLEPPRFSWKYAWIEPFFGCDAAKRASIMLPRVRNSCSAFWDRLNPRGEP